MNNYISLDGKYYATPEQAWVPKHIKPSTVRITVNGTLDATYGPDTLYVWTGRIKADVTARTASWGTPANARTSLNKQQGLTFYDHYGTQYTVHCDGYSEDSVSPMWDGNENSIYFDVTLIGVPA